MAYLDYNATTPLAPEALEAMLPLLTGKHGNPSSIHAEGRVARAAVDLAREELADLIGAKPHELIFTSGGTESCNLGVLGLARTAARCGDRHHVVTVGTEHHAVLHAMKHLSEGEGFKLTILPVGADGTISAPALQEVLCDETRLVSVMHANNETGVIQPIAELAAVCRASGVLIHTDAVQSFGKLPVNVTALGVDAISCAAHKFYGPKGVGFLRVRSGLELEPQLHGGGHENSRRPGTENVAGIVGMAAAARAAERMREFEAQRLRVLREALWAGIRSVAPHALRNGDDAHCLPNTLNVSFPGADGEALLIGLDIEGVSVSSGSACMVGSMQPSHVILAMGRDTATASASVRFSLGRDSSARDIDSACAALKNVLGRHHFQRSAA